MKSNPNAVWRVTASTAVVANYSTYHVLANTAAEANAAAAKFVKRDQKYEDRDIEIREIVRVCELTT